MKKDDKLLKDLGTEFKRTRTLKRLSLEKISSKTRINIDYLKAIEENRFDFLHRPYVLAFVKAYAHELGIDAETVKEKFNEHIRKQIGIVHDDAQNQDEKTVQPVEDRAARPASAVHSVDGNYSGNKNGKKNLKLVVAIVVFVILLIVLQKIFVGQDETQIITPQESEFQNRQTLNVLDTLNRKEPEFIPLELRVVTNEQLWFLISVDDQPPEEYLFSNNESKIWHAQEKFEVRAGKSVGFELFFNGKLLENLGDERTMIGKLVLTEKGLVDLQLPLQPPDTSNFRIEQPIKSHNFS